VSDGEWMSGGDDDKDCDGDASRASPMRSNSASPIAMVGIALLFCGLEIEPTVPAPPARMATNPPSGAGADWFTPPGPGRVVDGSTRCAPAAAEPRQSATSRMGNGDANTARPSVLACPRRRRRAR